MYSQQNFILFGIEREEEEKHIIIPNVFFSL
jgi:hypothetical protein